MLNNISVCLATYNGADHLREQIDSIVAQLLPGDELLVADDASTDKTLSILRAYEPVLSLVATDRAGGVVANFSRLLMAASGDIVVFSDQDDVWLPGRLECIRRELLCADMVQLDGAIVDANLQPSGNTISSVIGIRNGFWRNLWRNSFVGCCLAFRRRKFVDAWPLPKTIHMHDWYLGLIATLFGKVTRVPEVYLLYRRHGANASTTGEKSKFSLMQQLVNRAGMLLAVFSFALRRLCARSP
ncbi:glycosyltransferase [Janthinobacterium sp. TB1-E2]|uniref:Glycosyltransferase involved in cell wall bisynthesis n=2 Tax=Janthinobacterium TaxID=29580 RepID=A0AB38CHY7_9BURK|nr:glycosyltransferase [Janthinobacterium lividum]SFY35775.1 Glycosyltransferase involved in cell wall bisynthesis [Janthinobacterium lividum]